MNALQIFNQEICFEENEKSCRTKSEIGLELVETLGIF
jgi:hypothetical protein